MTNRQRRVRFLFLREWRSLTAVLDDDFLKEILSYCSYRIAEVGCGGTRIVGRYNGDEPRTDIDDLEKLSGICARGCITSTASEEMANLASRIAKSKLGQQLRSSGLIYRRLDRTIEYLSHIRELFAIFKDFRKRIRGSKSFSIVLLDPPPLVKLRGSSIEFANILKDLGVPTDTVPKCASKQWSRDHGLRAHAEIQIVLYAMEKGIGEFDPYIGCTLPSCFLCSKFLDNICQHQFRTRGTHGKLYPLWTVPKTPNIPLYTVGEIKRSLKAVYEQIKLCLEEPTQRCGNCPLQCVDCPLRCGNCPLSCFKDTGALVQHWLSKNHGPVASSTWSTGTQCCRDCPFREFRDAGALAQHCVAQYHRPA